MPISFWKDHSKVAVTYPDLCSLRERYIEDGMKVARRLVRNKNVLAIWLSGPFDYSRVQPRSDLHMTVLLRKGSGTFYHHQLLHFSEVGRRLEIAFFPLGYFQSALEKGFSQWASVFDLHKLKETVILHEKGRILSRMSMRLEAIKPSNLFVGKQIGALRSEAIHLEKLINERKFGESVLSSRQILMYSLMLLLPIGKSFIFSKISHLYPELKDSFPPSLVESFNLIQAVERFDETETEQRVMKSRDLVKFLFERQGVCAEGSC